MHRIEQTLWIHKIVIWSFVFIVCVCVRVEYPSTPCPTSKQWYLQFITFFISLFVRFTSLDDALLCSPFCSLFVHAVHAAFAPWNFVSLIPCAGGVFVSDDLNILCCRSCCRCEVLCVWAGLKLNGNGSVVVNKRWCNHDGSDDGFLSSHAARAQTAHKTIYILTRHTNHQTDCVSRTSWPPKCKSSELVMLASAQMHQQFRIQSAMPCNRLKCSSFHSWAEKFCAQTANEWITTLVLRGFSYRARVSISSHHQYR